MLTIGANTYVSVAETTKYIEAVFGDDSAVYNYWDDLENNQKEMFLTKSLMQIEALPFTGIRKYNGQALEFPRTRADVAQTLVGDIASEIPLSVKFAQIDNAIAMFNIAENSESKQRATLQRNGVKSFSLGEFSETYGNNSSILVYDVADQNVISYLKNWLSGSYKIV